MQPKLLQKENIHSEWMCQSAQFGIFSAACYCRAWLAYLPHIAPTPLPHPKVLALTNAQVISGFCSLSTRVTGQISQNTVRTGQGRRPGACEGPNQERWQQWKECLIRELEVTHGWGNNHIKMTAANTEPITLSPQQFVGRVMGRAHITHNSTGKAQRIPG